MFFRLILLVAGLQQAHVYVNADLGTALETVRFSKKVLKTVMGKHDADNLLLPELLNQFPDVAKTKALIDEGIEIFHLSQEIVRNVTEVWRYIEAVASGFNISLAALDIDVADLPFVNEQRILNRITDVSAEIRRLEAKLINSASWTVESINRYMKLNTKLELTLHELAGLMYRISSMERTMHDLVENRETLERSTIENFANMVVSPAATSVEGLLDRIHVLVTGSVDFEPFGYNGILKMVSNDLNESQGDLCTQTQSAQLIIYQMYSAISAVELKGYALMQFSWLLLKTYGAGNFTTEAALMRRRFNQRNLRTHQLLKQVLESADKSIWRCDPAVHVEGVTFIMLTGLMQGYLENEVDLNQGHSCWKNCDHYQLTENFGCYHSKEVCSRQRRCSGKVMNCRFVDAVASICPANPFSHRRYEQITYDSGKALGKLGKCVQNTWAAKSWRRWIFWKCSYCFCHCDEVAPTSDRYINLKESVTDVDGNRVVTGLKFVKKYRVIHLRIQEGELLPRGHILPNSTRWQPLNDYTLLDNGIVEGVDFYSVDANRRAMNLDDIYAPASHVVTGVRFRVHDSHLRLEIRVTEQDFASGKLLVKTSKWLANVNDKGRTLLKLEHPDVPTSSHKNRPDSRSDDYVQFQHSDIHLDAAQSTVPYFDAQEVVAVPPVPLSGAGIYHKGHQLSGGFLAPKILTYDFASHVQPPDRKERK